MLVPCRFVIRRGIYGAIVGYARDNDSGAVYDKIITDDMNRDNPLEMVKGELVHTGKVTITSKPFIPDEGLTAVVVASSPFDNVTYEIYDLDYKECDNDEDREYPL